MSIEAQIDRYLGDVEATEREWEEFLRDNPEFYDHEPDDPEVEEAMASWQQDREDDYVNRVLSSREI